MALIFIGYACARGSRAAASRPSFRRQHRRRCRHAAAAMVRTTGATARSTATDLSVHTLPGPSPASCCCAPGLLYTVNTLTVESSTSVPLACSAGWLARLLRMSCTSSRLREYDLAGCTRFDACLALLAAEKAAAGCDRGSSGLMACCRMCHLPRLRLHCCIAVIQVNCLDAATHVFSRRFI